MFVGGPCDKAPGASPFEAAGVSSALAFLAVFFAGAGAPASTTHTPCPTTTESPSLTNTSTTVPEVGARTSMVTLSVSICAIISSTSTRSPGCFRMAAILPSVMESPIGGIATVVSPATKPDDRNPFVCKSSERLVTSNGDHRARTSSCARCIASARLFS